VARGRPPGVGVAGRRPSISAPVGGYQCVIDVTRPIGWLLYLTAARLLSYGEGGILRASFEE
jgi:hypothetical protein